MLIMIGSMVFDHQGDPRVGERCIIVSWLSPPRYLYSRIQLLALRWLSRRPLCSPPITTSKAVTVHNIGTWLRTCLAYLLTPLPIHLFQFSEVKIGIFHPLPINLEYLFPISDRRPWNHSTSLITVGICCLITSNPRRVLRRNLQKTKKVNFGRNQDV